jgi:hypothetical protein
MTRKLLTPEQLKAIVDFLMKEGALEVVPCNKFHQYGDQLAQEYYISLENFINMVIPEFAEDVTSAMTIFIQLSAGEVYYDSYRCDHEHDCCGCIYMETFEGSILQRDDDLILSITAIAHINI